MKDIPHNRQAEIGLLACLIEAPKLSHEVFGAITPDDLYSPDVKAVYEAIQSMEAAGTPLDLNGLGAEMQKREQFRFLGSILSETPGFLITYGSCREFIREVKECSARRELIRVAELAKEAAYDRDSKLPALLDQWETDALAVRSSMDAKSHHISSLREIMVDLAGVLEERLERHKSGRLQGFSTGFPDLDRVTNGLVGSRVYMIGARPKMGKTSLMRQILLHTCRSTPCYVVSLEMNRHQMGEMLISQEGRIEADAIAKGDFRQAGPQSLANVQRVIMNLAQLPILLDDRIQTAAQIAANTRRMIQKHKIGCLFVDYLQLIAPADPKERSDMRIRVQNASAMLVNIAKEHNIPVVAVVQLNREAEGITCDQLNMGMIRECGAIEQDAAFIGLIGPMPEKDSDSSVWTVDSLTGERVRQETSTDESSTAFRRIGMHVAANRFGPGGDVLPMRFEGRYLTFYPETMQDGETR